MTELRALAKSLLESGKVGVVIGWEEGPRGVRPAFVTQPEDVERLVFDTRCVQNLVSYVAPRRKHLAGLGRKAVVVKGCDARALAGLIRETQLAREDVEIIAVRCGGVLRSDAGRGTAIPSAGAELTTENVADRCAGCPDREPRLADHLLGDLPPAPPESPRRTARIAELEALTHAQRWEFWQGELERCVRCHACREVCPMCFCERCVADKSVPQWIETSSHPRANLAWHLTRALHEAGRCCDCGECERACPADIPLGLLNRKLGLVVEERYGCRVTDDPTQPGAVGAFKLNDSQEFIL